MCFRLLGDIIYSDWWLDGRTGDQSELVQTMNTYADAWYGTGTAACTLVFSGVIQIANQVTLGTAGTGTLKAFNIDAAGAVFDVITGGNLESTAKITALVIRNCHRSMIQFAQIKCNHICGGVTVESCSNTVFDGLHLHQFDWRGLWVKGSQSSPAIGNSSGAVFNKITGSEWTSGEAEFQVNSNFVSDGITNDSNDVRFTFAHIGWCYRAIVNNAGSCEYISCHPFNGNADNPANSAHRFCFWNEGGGNVNIYDMYGDNGYVVDNVGGLTVRGLEMLDLNSTMTHPYLRVRTDNGTVNGSIEGSKADIGFFTGAFAANFANADTDFQHDISGGGFNGGNTWDIGRKRVRYIYGTPSPDTINIKEGNSTSTAILERYYPGTGNVAVAYQNNYIAVQSGTGDSGEVRVSRTVQTGIGSSSNGQALQFYANGASRGRFESGGVFRPDTDNTQNLGTGAQRWATVYAGTGTINTSDEREKQDVRDISEAEKAVAQSLRGLFKAYRFKDAVNRKSDGARIHFGILAQDAAKAFEAQGLDPFRYGVICYDEWPDELGENGKPISPAGNRWGVRYDELLAFIVAAL